MAKLPSSLCLDNSFDNSGFSQALNTVSAGDFYILEDEVTKFVNYARNQKGEAFEGLVVAEKRDASVEVVISEQDMLASMVVTGPYAGQGLRGPDVIRALSEAHVSKGINKLALKKVLVVSNSLKAGETFTQPVAQGKNPIQGKDVKFKALVEDSSKRVLAPSREDDGADKVDMLNLGETVTVDAGQPLMRRIPATKGESGITVQGKKIPPKPGNDATLSPANGSHISAEDPNLLLATVSGMPIIKPKTVEVDNALCLNSIGVATGHIKFKGNIIVRGDIESDMVVRATGNITVGGFIESANVQAQGDIEVSKGIIGHTVSEGEPKSCVVKSGGNIKANYAQYSELQASEDINLSVHCMGAIVRCGGNLTISDAKEKQGTLSGGETKVGGKITCVNLGVEGDTATLVEGFARYGMYKDRIAKYKAQYKQAQEGTMEVIRRELEFKKKPKSERSDSEEQQLELFKQKANATLERAKNVVDSQEEEFSQLLETNIIEVKGKVYTHVTVQFGEEKVITKRSHGASNFSFNQYEIKCQSLLNDESLDQGI